MKDFLIKRSNEKELMDDFNCEGEVVEQTLKELRIINHWLGGNQVTIEGFKNLKLKSHSETRLSIADLGSGGGDMIRKIHGYLSKQEVNFSLTGIDANPAIIEYAQKNTHQLNHVSFRHMDVFSEEFETMRLDYVTFTLFAHHFTNKELIILFSKLKKVTRKGIVVNDLHRHWLAFHSIRFLTKWFSRSPMVKNDAPLSVARSFRKEDWERIFKEAEIEKFEIKWKWAFRWMIIIRL